MADRQLAVRMRGITKEFAGKVVANKDVDLDIYRGEVLALLGDSLTAAASRSTASRWSSARPRWRSTMASA